MIKASRAAVSSANSRAVPPLCCASMPNSAAPQLCVSDFPILN
jgi:hypothetical protein